MPAQLEIADDPRRLTFSVAENGSLWKATGALVFGVIFLAFVLHFFVGVSRLAGLFFLGLCALSMIRDLIAYARGTRVVLRVTNLELTSTGFAKDYSPSSIPRANVQRLEYRKESGGGGESAACPSGLYVEGRRSLWSTQCLLPNIDEAQTNQVIDRIYARFPDTSTSALTGPEESGIITLGLSRP